MYKKNYNLVIIGQNQSRYNIFYENNGQNLYGNDVSYDFKNLNPYQ